MLNRGDVATRSARRWQAVVVFLYCCITTVLADTTSIPTNLCAWTSGYLPDTVGPTGYDLVLELNTNSTDPLVVNRINGTVKIGLYLDNATNCVVISGLKPPMSYSRITMQQDGVLMQVSNVAYNDTYKTAILGFPSPIMPSAQQSILQIDFTYPVRTPEAAFTEDYPDVGLRDATPATGVFRIPHKDANSGIVGDIVYANFQPSGARAAFPCFDEPRFKVPMNLTIIAPPGDFTVLANMPEASGYLRQDGKVVHSFMTTPPMSTYIFAFVVGKMQNQSIVCSTDYGPRVVSSWAVPDVSPTKISPSVDYACKALQMFSKMFQRGYALPKLDNVALPVTNPWFPGALENWGLVTYAPDSLLVDPQTDSISDIENVAILVSHELLHQWIGNLVTTSNWTRLWMNEGFANYFEFVGTDFMLPNYDIYRKLQHSNAVVGLKADSSLGPPAFPMTVAEGDMADPMEQESLFNSITYNKAGSVLRMLRSYLNRGRLKPRNFIMRRSLAGGAHHRANFHRRMLDVQSNRGGAANKGLNSTADPFVDALAQYVNKFAYKAVNPKDLWGTMAIATGEPRIPHWMAGWADRTSYPVLSVSRDPRNPKKVLVTQQSVMNWNAGNATTCVQPLWWIPMAYLTKSTSSSFSWTMMDQKCQVSFMAPVKDWVLINAGRYGFYQVDYNAEMAKQLARAAYQGQFDPVDLAGLLYDTRPAIAGSPVKHSNQDKLVNSFLDYTRALGSTLSLAPWAAAKLPLQKLSKSIADSADAQCVKDLQSYMASLARGVMTPSKSFTPQPSVFPPQPLNFSVSLADSPDLRFLRPIVLDTAVAGGDPSIIQQTVGLVRSDSLSKVHPDVFKSAVNAAVANGSVAVWNMLKTQYENMNNTLSDDQRSTVLDALFSGSAPSVINASLAYLASGDFDLSAVQHLLPLQAGVAPHALNMSWNWLADQSHNTIYTKLNGTVDDLASLASSLSSNMKSQAWAPLVTAFTSKFNFTTDVAHDLVAGVALGEVKDVGSQTQIEAACNWLKDYKAW